MKTYYDGEDREIVRMNYAYHHPVMGDIWEVVYMRGGSRGHLYLAAKDELDVYRRFPEALEQLSKNDDREF